MENRAWHTCRYNSLPKLVFESSYLLQDLQCRLVDFCLVSPFLRWKWLLFERRNTVSRTQPQGNNTRYCGKECNFARELLKMHATGMIVKTDKVFLLPIYLPWICPAHHQGLKMGRTYDLMYDF